jgi:Zn finger protein HypA/HybF involved in hydrogenase expression
VRPEHGVANVRGVTLRIGALSGVDQAALAFA